MAPLTKYCCCFSLRTGGVIIGWLGLVASIIDLCLYVPALMYLNETGKDMFHGLITDRIALEGARTAFACLIAYEVVEILHHSALIYGTCKDEHLFLLPWLIMNVLKVAFFGVLNMILIGVAANSKNAQLITGVLMSLLIFAFYFYIWLCISALHTEIKNKRQKDNSNGRSDSVSLLETETSGIQYPPYRHH